MTPEVWTKLIEAFIILSFTVVPMTLIYFMHKQDLRHQRWQDEQREKRERERRAKVDDSDWWRRN